MNSPPVLTQKETNTKTPAIIAAVVVLLVVVVFGTGLLPALYQATQPHTVTEVQYQTPYVTQYQNYQSAYVTPQLTAPILIYPPDGSVFNYYPRTLTLSWQAGPGAQPVYYDVQVQYGFLGTWTDDFWAKNLYTTSYTFDFIGAQPGRWRVFAVNPNPGEGNVASVASAWWYFTFTQ